MEPKFFRTQAECREWFEKNHDIAGEAWIGYYKRSTGKESITWEQSVEVAICFGWIDGIRKSIDEQCYKIRFTPRKSRSIWSLKNINTAEKMIKEGLMLPPGKEAYKKRQDKKSGVYSFEQEKVAFSKFFESSFRKNKRAWEFFKSQAPYYQRTAIHWVMSAKKAATRNSRLYSLITDSANQVRIKPLRRNND
jgi:uncharacterized protein YdeI (YjbR/CyaY-like superfamily)